jgi:hypothetical protein
MPGPAAASVVLCGAVASVASLWRLANEQERSQAEDQDEIVKRTTIRNPAIVALEDIEEILARPRVAHYPFPVPSGIILAARDEGSAASAC